MNKTINSNAVMKWQSNWHPHLNWLETIQSMIKFDFWTTLWNRQRNNEMKFTPARYEIYFDICIRIDKKIQGVLHIAGCFLFYQYIIKYLLQLGRNFTFTFYFSIQPKEWLKNLFSIIFFSNLNTSYILRTPSVLIDACLKQISIPWISLGTRQAMQFQLINSPIPHEKFQKKKVYK